MEAIKQLAYRHAVIGSILLACGCSAKMNQRSQPLPAGDPPVSSVRHDGVHDPALPFRGRLEIFETCMASDLTLPLQPLPTPAARERDTIPQALEDPRARRGSFTQKLSPNALRKKYQSHLDFHQKYSLKTVRGLMIDGPRTCEDVSATIMHSLAPMRYAYNKRLREDPGLCGNVGFWLVIPASGEVIDCKVVEATMRKTVLQDTLVNQILKWRFDRLPDATDTTRVAFRFWCGS